MRTHSLHLADGRTVTIRELPGHYADKEYDFALDERYVGGGSTRYNEALTNAVAGVEERLGVKVLWFS